jgi:Ca2+-binding RTX toxin-like protein
VGTGGDSLRVQLFFHGWSWYQEVQQARFADGTVWSRTNLEQLTDTRGATDQANSLNGTTGADLLRGLAGDDALLSLGGNDIVFGGDGNDTVDGGDGADTLSGGAGDDLIIAGAGADTIRFGRGDGQDIYISATDDWLDDVIFFAELGRNDLWFGKSGDDLLVRILSADDAILLQNWFDEQGAGSRAAGFRAGNQFLSHDQVLSLVDAMEAVAPGEADPDALPNSVLAAIEAAWQTQV